jgi:hypothetical protein
MKGEDDVPPDRLRPQYVFFTNTEYPMEAFSSSTALRHMEQGTVSVLLYAARTWDSMLVDIN